MASQTVSILTERQEALKFLESAFGQSNGGMTFTYNGGIYQVLGVNSDDTLRVMNTTTGQVTASMDPIDVYTSAMVSAGTPVPSAPAPVNPSAQGPSMYTTITSQVGTYSGLINTGSQISKVNTFIKGIIPGFTPIMGSITAFLSASSIVQGIQGMFQGGISKGSLLGLGMNTFGMATGINMLAGMSGAAVFTAAAGWATAGAVIAASIEYGSIKSLIQNGVTVSGVALAAGSFLGTAVMANLSLELLHLFGVSSLFGPIGFAIAAAVALVTILLSLFNKPPAEQVAAQNLTQALNPVVWTPGPLALVGVGTVALLMGWGSAKTPPAMASLTVPAYHLNQVLAASGISNLPVNTKTPSLIVEPGDGKVVIVTPAGTDSHGDALVKLQSYNVGKDLQFVSSSNAPPEGSYIPFFTSTNGKVSTTPNQELINALNIQQKMLEAVLSGTLSGQDAMNAMNVALASNKYGITPDY